MSQLSDPLFSALLSLGAALSTLLTVNGDEPRFYCGELRYEAKKHIRMQEGTFECWFKLGMPPADFHIGDGSSRRMLVFLSLTFAPTKNTKDRELPDFLTLKYANLREKNGLKVVVNDTLVKKMTLDQEELNWEADTWYHLAFTWKQQHGQWTLQWFINGKLRKTCQTDEPGTFTALPAKTIIRIGRVQSSTKETKFDSGGIGAIDEFRISSRVRSPEEIRQAMTKGMTTDEATLLHETFAKVRISRKKWSRSAFKSLMRRKNDLPSNGSTRPEKGDKGEFYGPVRWVDGRKSGDRAVAFFVKP